MSIVRKIEIDGQDVLFKASAAIPRIYRLKFQCDIYNLNSALNYNEEGTGTFILNALKIAL